MSHVGRLNYNAFLLLISKLLWPLWLRDLYWLSYFCPLHPGLIILRRCHHFSLETHPSPLSLFPLFSPRAVSEAQKDTWKRTTASSPGRLREGWDRARAAEWWEMSQHVSVAVTVRAALVVSRRNTHTLCVPPLPSHGGPVGRKMCFGAQRRKSPQEL